EDISRYVLMPQDLLFTRYNGNPDLVANCGRVQDINEKVIYPDKLIRVRVDRNRISSAFLEAVVSAPQSRTALAPFIKSAAGQHGISGADLKRVRIPLPTLEYQEEIVANLKAALSTVEDVSQESDSALSLVDRLDESMLAKAFRGELID